jgi:hypothetical protein
VFRSMTRLSFPVVTLSLLLLLAMAVPAAGNTIVAQDAFGRTISNGWGNAQSGGAYALRGSSSDFSVDGSSGLMRLSVAGTNRAAALPQVSARDVDLSLRVATDKLAVGGPMYVYAAVRRVSTTTAYWLKLRLGTNRAVYVQASRLVNNVEQGLGSEVRVDGLTHVADSFIRLRGQATGSNPTAIRVKAWAEGQAEPSGWAYSATDSTSSLQTTGALDLRAYLSSKATNAPVNVRFDDLEALSLGTSSPPPGDTAVLVGAGDIAHCSRSTDEATAKLLDGIEGTVFAAGDNVNDGLAQQFRDCYAPTWGRHKDRTKPALGNREYLVSDATPYFDYFGSVAGERGKGWYAYGLGAWRVYMLNSNCKEVGCGAGSAQERWLRADLAANPRQCTAAIMHHPRFTSSYGSDGSVRALWQALYDHRADLVVSGHAHNYERFSPQNPAGGAEPNRGIRQFVAGTGGHSLYGFETNAANSEVRNANTHGVLKLTLKSASYEWQFVPVAGKTFTDSGSANCV